MNTKIFLPETISSLLVVETALISCQKSSISRGELNSNRLAIVIREFHIAIPIFRATDLEVSTLRPDLNYLTLCSKETHILSVNVIDQTLVDPFITYKTYMNPCKDCIKKYKAYKREEARILAEKEKNQKQQSRDYYNNLLMLIQRESLNYNQSRTIVRHRPEYFEIIDPDQS